MDRLPDALKRALGVATSDPAKALEELAERFLGHTSIDPTGAAQAVSSWAPRYRDAAVRTHREFIAAWKTGHHGDALVHVHFFLNAVSRVVAFMNMAAKHMGGDVAAHVSSHDFSSQSDARNHFEHIEDRLFGTKRNEPKPITENGATRTIHIGLRAKDCHLTYGDNQVDVSEKFLEEFLSVVAKFEALGRVDSWDSQG